MIGSLDPEERVLSDPSVAEQISDLMDKMGWDCHDDIRVESAGSSVYAIDGAGTKWAPLKGTVKYNKDAFIVIKNLSRNPTVPSNPNPELKPHHGSDSTK